MFRPIRLALSLALAACAYASTAHAPGRPTVDPLVHLVPIGDLNAATPPPGMARVEGAWMIEGGDRQLGGFSTLDILPDGRLWALADFHLRAIAFTPPNIGEAKGTTLSRTGGGGMIYGELGSDVEALTHDARHFWAVNEAKIGIVRYGASPIWQPQRMRIVAEWAKLPFNRQIEAFQRLQDGRFLAIAEGGEDWWRKAEHPGFLYRADPTLDTHPIPFTLIAPDGYHPTDLTLLPDGRVALLLRAINWPALGFKAKIVVVDPAQITLGAEVRGTEIADIRPPSLVDNLEGIAAQPLADGSMMFWLISDNNGMRVLQRSLLLAYRWDPRVAGTVSAVPQ